MTKIIKIAILFICMFNQKCVAQSLIEKIDESDGFYTRSFFLYSDSTFAYLRGGCTQLYFTTGKCKSAHGNLVLIPDSTFVPEVHLEKYLIDTCSMELDVVFITKDLVEFDSDWNLVPIGAMNSWNSKNEEPIFFFINSNSVLEIDTLSFKPRKQDCLNYELVLTDLYTVYSEIYTFPISPNVHRAEIKCNIPIEIAQYHVMGILRFATLDSSSLSIGNKNYEIEKIQ